MNRLPLLGIMIEIKELNEKIARASADVDVAYAEELMDQRFQLEMELF